MHYAYCNIVGDSTSTPNSFAFAKIALANFGFKSSGQYLKYDSAALT